MHKICGARQTVAVGACLGVAIWLWGCGDGGGTGPDAEEETGSIQVTVTTSGSDLDTDGYEITLDGNAQVAISTEGSVTLNNVPAGTHEIGLSGIASTCWVAGENPASVNCSCGTTAIVAFDVTCAAPAPAPGKIAFMSDRDGTWQFYVSDGDGGHVTLVPTSLDLDPERGFFIHQPLLSPDGSRILFAYDDPSSETWWGWGDITVVNVDGSGMVNLTPENNVVGSQPSWSPDGTRIAFKLWHTDLSENEGMKTAVANVDGSGFSVVADFSGSYSGPDWSPDGSQIVFGAGDYQGGRRGIWVVNADDGELMQIAKPPAGDETYAYPDWQPAGDHIVFSNYKGGDSYELLIVNADGSELSSYSIGALQRLMRPKWAPDGTMIAAYTTRGGLSEITVVNPDGTVFGRTTGVDANLGYHAWAPDGSKLAYTVRWWDAPEAIYTANPNGTGVRQLFQGEPGRYWLGSWSW